MRQFNFPHILSLHTAFVNNSNVYFVTPIMCYNSCRDAMNNYFVTGEFIVHEFELKVKTPAQKIIMSIFLISRFQVFQKHWYL